MNLFFDVETSGKFDFKSGPTAEHQPHLVQLAALLIAEDGNTIAAAMNFIVEPQDWEISKEVENIHHISTTLAKSVGIPRKVVLAAFNHMSKNARIICAHNLNFDFNVMLSQYAREKQQHRMGNARQVCTMLASAPVLKLPKPFVPRGPVKPGDDWKWPTLAEAYAHFHNGETFSGAHNAQSDVMALVAVYNALVKGKHITP